MSGGAAPQPQRPVRAPAGAAGAVEGGQPLRLAVVGAGIGARYAESFQRVPGVEVVALCASSTRNAAPAAARLGIAEVHTDVALMLERCQPDIVAVATPNDTHHEITLQALDAGAHVLCDKPLAMDAPQALAMWRAAEQRGARHVVPFWWRFLPAIAQAHELLADGSFGEPYFLNATYLNCGWGDPQGPMRWQFDTARAGSGALGNVGSHAIHVVQWLAGELTRVCAHTKVNVPLRRWPDGSPARPDGEDTVAFVAALDNGAPVSFIASSVAHEARSCFSVSFHLSEGSVTVEARSQEDGDVRARLLAMRRGESAPREVAPQSSAAGAPGALGGAGGPGGAGALLAIDRAYTEIATELIAAIREGRPAAPGFREALRVQEVIDAAQESVASDGWVQVRRAEL